MVRPHKILLNVSIVSKHQYKHGKIEKKHILANRLMHENTSFRRATILQLGKKYVIVK